MGLSRIFLFIGRFRYNGITLYRYSDLFENDFWGKMGNLGNLGVMGSEITEFSSEQNKNSSTLFKFSSEIKIICSELFFHISGVKNRGSKPCKKFDE